MKRAALLVDNFVSNEECASAVRWFYKTQEGQTLAQFKTSDVHYRMIGDSQKEECPVVDLPEMLKSVWYRMLDLAREEYNCELQWAQLYKWNVGSKMAMHHDVASRATRLTSVIWLNDDFEGGELRFRDGTTFVPRKGRAIFYDGIENHHEVLEVKKATRWAIAAWYKDIECNTNSMKTT